MVLSLEEVEARSILTKSGIPGVDYCINPYIGCSHGCRYCYATFMKRFTRHTQMWGHFVDVKLNAPQLLKKQLEKAKRGNVILSSVTDPYQLAEAKYRITRQCLEVLLQYQYPVEILTKSPLVSRDIDLISRFDDISVGLTITTDDEKIKRIFEPKAPPIGARLGALRKLHEKGISTFVFVGPVLPMNPETLAGMIRPYADSVVVDTMNYAFKTERIYKGLNMNLWLDKHFLDDVVNRLAAALDIPVEVL
ncbi:MAG: radical SAM protein [Nitrospirae bacterium]|nr:radical SAM protein [Nitrospirota bacterium]